MVLIHFRHESLETWVHHRAVESLSKNLRALWPSTRMLSLNLSLIFTRFRIEILVNHGFIIGKFVDIASLHVFMLDHFVVWLELPLNFLHFNLNFLILLDLKLSLQVFSHVSGVFRL